MKGRQNMKKTWGRIAVGYPKFPHLYPYDLEKLELYEFEKFELDG